MNVISGIVMVNKHRGFTQYALQEVHSERQIHNPSHSVICFVSMTNVVYHIQ